jgi:hypothetical protein
VWCVFDGVVVGGGVGTVGGGADVVGAVVGTVVGGGADVEGGADV